MPYAEALPTIRIDLNVIEHMRQTICASIITSHAEIEKHIAAVIEHFDFKKAVEQETIRCLDSQPRNSVERAVSEIFYDIKVKEIIKIAVMEVLQGRTESE